MRLYSPTTEYTVVARLEATAADDARYLARDAAGARRLIVLAEGEARAKRLTPLLFECRDASSFTGFVEFFPHKDGLAAVFAWEGGGEPLEEALQEAPTPLRAAVLRALFAKLLLQEIPEPMLCEALRPENMLTAASGDVRFLYALPEDGREEDIAVPPPVTSAQMLAAWARCIGGAEVPPGYPAFCQALDEGFPREPAERFAVAEEAAKALAEYVPPPKPEGFSLTKLKERALKTKDALAARWKTIAAVAVMLIAYGAVGWLFYSTVIAPPRVDNGIAAIGTVVVADA